MQQPIGYWLKHVDRLIEAMFDHTLADFGLGRRHWQTLNVLAAGAQPETALADAMAPFWGDAGGPTRAVVLRDLVRRGWIVSDDMRYSLTPSGESAHRQIAERVQRARQRATTGLSAEEYANTLDTLERIAANLEACLTT